MVQLLQISIEKKDRLEVKANKSFPEDPISKSMKEIVFKKSYLLELKNKISSLTKGHTSQKELKKLIIDHEYEILEELKSLIEFKIESGTKKVNRQIETEKDRNIQYKKILSKLGPKIEKIYRKLNNKS